MNGQSLSNTRLRRWLFFTSMLLLGIANEAWAATLIQSLTATPSTAQVGEDVVVNYVISTTGDHFPENGTAVFTLLSGGSPLDRFTDTSILATENIQNGLIQGSVSLASFAQSFQTPGTYQVQMDISGREPGPQAPISYSDSRSTSFQVVAPITAVTPTSLTLSGAPGQTVTGTFSITQGQGPFTASAQFGSVSTTSPTLGETVTYSHPISATATPGTQLSDTITVTPASGEAVTISVTIDVTGQDLVVQPTSLTLSGTPGQAVSGTFSVTQGQGPFSAAAAQGTLSTTSPTLGETVTYSHPISATATPGTQLSDTITVTPAFGEAVTIPVTIDVTSQDLVVQPTSLTLSGTPGQTVSGTFSVTQGQGPFSAAAAQGTLSTTSPTLGETVTYSHPISATATPGTQLSDTITVTPAFGEAVTIPVTINVTQPQQQPVMVQPATLTVTGDGGSGSTATFTITSGTPPFSLQSTDPQGRGSFSNANPGLNETVTYTFAIPADASDGQQFSDNIIVTAADGAQATIRVDITAQVADTSIDQAMQDIAQTQPQRATAAVIGTICPQGIVEPRLQQDCNALVGGALSTDGTVKDQAGTALGQVTTDQASAPLNASQTSIQTQTRNVGTRIAALRGGVRGLSARGFSFNLNGQNLQPGQLASGMMQQLAEGTGGAAGSDTILDFGRLGVFINGSISLGDKSRTDNVAGFDLQTTGITLGADYRFTDTLVGGIAFGYSRNDLDLDANGGSLDTDGYSLSLYGTFYEHAGLYLDGILSYGWNDFDQDRAIRYTITNGAGSALVNQIASASYSGHQWSASLGGGYSMNRGALAFGPTARLEYVDTKVNSFQETMSNPTLDGGGWATRINSQDSQSFNLQLGGDLSYTMSQSWGVLIPQAHAEWVHEFDEGSQSVSGHFVQDPSRTTFSLNTDKADPDYFNLRLGVSAQFAEGRSAFLYYQKLLGYSDLDIDTVAAGLRLEF